MLIMKNYNYYYNIAINIREVNKIFMLIYWFQFTYNIIIKVKDVIDIYVSKLD